MRFGMHKKARWSTRQSYVVLAFILIIVALVLAGCASVRPETKEKGTVTAAAEGDVSGVVDDESRSTTHGVIIGANAVR
jgi:uncharacterized protein YceK